MNTTDLEKFESLWDDFMARVKGRLTQTAGKQSVTPQLASLILSEAASSWQSDYEAAGVWLRRLTETDPDRARLVSDVLLKDMHFDEVPTPPARLPVWSTILFPLIGAGAALAATQLLGCSKQLQVIITVAAGFSVLAVVDFMRNPIFQERREKHIASLLEQLWKYKHSVISILS